MRSSTRCRSSSSRIGRRPTARSIELTVYPPNELRNRPRSSTDGKPIVRLRDTKLRLLCEKEHGDLWRRYVEDGVTPTLEDILAAEEAGDAEPAVREDVFDGAHGDGGWIDDESEDEPPDEADNEAAADDVAERAPGPRGSRRAAQRTWRATRVLEE